MSDQATLPEEIQNVKDELIALAEKGEIKQSVAYIKKANKNTLEKIKKDYERKQREETNEYLAEMIVKGISYGMKTANVISDSENMEDELLNNKIIKRDFKNALDYVTPIVPYIGILCAAGIVVKHTYYKKPEEPEE